MLSVHGLCIIEDTSANPISLARSFLFLFRSPLHRPLDIRTWSASFHLPYLLPSSVSRNSFVCHSCENCWRVHQQSPFRLIRSVSEADSTHSNHHSHPRSFFSCTYELQILQFLCFDIPVKCSGVVSPSKRKIRNATLQELVATLHPANRGNKCVGRPS